MLARFLFSFSFQSMQLGLDADEEDWRRAILEHASSRGGPHQRSSASASGQPRTGVRSALAEHLLVQWAFGLFSARQVQSLASMAVADISAAGGGALVDLQKLAGFGGGGSSAEHCRRDLVEYVKTLIVAPSTMLAKLPLQILKGPESGAHLLDQCYMEPHRWFAFLWENFRQQFFERFIGPPGAIESFWKGVRLDDPRRKCTPGIGRPDLHTRGIPIAVYGDGVPCTTKGSLDCIGWESLTCCESPSMTRIQFISAFMTNAAVKEGDSLPPTKKEIWKPIVPSFLSLESGRWPAQGPRGEDLDKASLDFLNRGAALAGGYYCIIWVVKGDTEWKCNSLGLVGHWGSAHPCISCKAELADGAMSYRNVSPGAPWKTTLHHDYDSWRAFSEAMGKDPTIFFLPRSEGGLGLANCHVFGDILHCVDLGVALHVCGNVLWHLCYTDMLPGAHPPSKCKAIWGEILAEYKRQHVHDKIDSLSIHRFCDSDRPAADYPVLKAKAAMARKLVPVLQVVWQKHCRDSEYEQHVQRVLDNLKIFYDCVSARSESDEYPLHLPAGVVLQLQQAVDRCLAHYAFLSGQCLGMSPRRLLWNFVPKFHHFWHLGQEAKLQSPRLSWTYANEDWVGHLSCMGESCRHAVIPAKRSSSIVTNWVLGTCLQIFFAE